jgi:hypothetical protein
MRNGHDLNIRATEMEIELEQMASGRSRRGSLIGKHIKVVVAGEAPWAIVTAVLDDGRIVARLDNRCVGGLTGDMHGYTYGDVATFREREVEPGAFVIELAPLDEQVPVGPRAI